MFFFLAEVALASLEYEETTVQVYVVLYGVQLVHLVVPGKVYRGVLTNGWPCVIKRLL